ncbi:hypothetical protein ACHQM5_009747 [Ranunculus cassubicifolius]
MNVLFWNIRGIRRTNPIPYLVALVEEFKPDVIGIAEPLINPDDNLAVFNQIGFTGQLIHNHTDLRTGNIWIKVRDGLDYSIVSLDNQQISIRVQDKYISVVHASSSYIVRRDLWTQLTNNIPVNAPRVVIGDFNVVMYNSEKKGRRGVCRSAVEDFNSFIESNALLDSTNQGLRFSWCNKQRGLSRTYAKLDRALVNKAWLDLTHCWRSKILTRKFSDHSPVIAWNDHIPKPHNIPFRFKAIWIQHEEFKEFVKKNWDQPMVSGPLSLLSLKLKRLKEGLKIWNKQHFWGIRGKINNISSELDNVQISLEEDAFDTELQDIETALEEARDNFINLENDMWQQRAKSKNLFEGERNSSYYHNRVKIRAAKSFITSIEDKDGKLLRDHEEIKNHIVQAFQDRFARKPVEMDNDLLNLIPNSMSTHCAVLDRIPDEDEVKATVFTMNAGSSPGPDGFHGLFFQSCWEIVGKDVTRAVISFFKDSFMPSSLNSNFIILLPKIRNPKNVSHYRPICLSNFAFKIVTKILAVRLAGFADKVISQEQLGFIKGRCSMSGIALASEMANEMHLPRKGGNLGLKLDISQAYDSISWEFLLAVLGRFGFSNTWCEWIKAIIQSSRFSIILNGGPVGFFATGRGLKQGDPLSPILFAFAQDILSRALNQLFEENQVKYMVRRKGVNGPTHLMFADDVFLFANGQIKGIKVLYNLLKSYQKSSGQILNTDKCKTFLGCMNTSQRNEIKAITGINEGVWPETYLGVPLFKGTPRRRHIQILVDKIRKRASAWLGRQLSFQGRNVIATSVLGSIPIHNLGIYKWPVSCTNEAAKSIRNFSWSGNPMIRKGVTLNFDSVCKPREEGGLNLRMFKELNDALLMKLAWHVLNGTDNCARFLRAKFKSKKGKWIEYHKSSSIWKGLKVVLPKMNEFTTWQVGNGESLNIWRDPWTGCAAVADRLQGIQWQNLEAKVSSLIRNNQWHFPPQISVIFEKLGIDLHRVLPPMGGPDTLIWKPTQDGSFSVKSAYEAIRKKNPISWWCKKVWAPHIHPRISALAWKLFQKAVATDDRVKKMGIHVVSGCSACMQQEETLQHLLWDCPKAIENWVWIHGFFGIPLGPLEPKHILFACKHKGEVIRKLWESAVIHMMVNTWLHRNRVRMDNGKYNPELIKTLVRKGMRDSAALISGTMENSVEELMLLANLGTSYSRFRRAPRIKEIKWYPPPPNTILACCDGASAGNPGRCGMGIVFRDEFSRFKGVLSAGLPIGTNFDAETEAIVKAAEIAVNQGWKRLLIHSDSKSAISAFSSNPPWHLRARWGNASAKLDKITLGHVYREINFAADAAAKHGVTLDRGTEMWSIRTPLFLAILEEPYRPYFRFS